MQQSTTLPGDVLLVTAFISYVGCFTKQFRLDLLNKMWLTYLKTLEVFYEYFINLFEYFIHLFLILMYFQASNSNNRRLGSFDTSH